MARHMNTYWIFAAHSNGMKYLSIPSTNVSDGTRNVIWPDKRQPRQPPRATPKLQKQLAWSTWALDLRCGKRRKSVRTGRSRIGQKKMNKSCREQLMSGYEWMQTLSG